jgi:hypothetical protein
MATKPADTFVHATNAVYTTGPADTLSNKENPPDIPNGFLPGNDIAAEHLNKPLNISGQWTGWLLAGQSAASADTHIVETDADGETSLLGLTVGNSSLAVDRVLDVQNDFAGATALIRNHGAGIALSLLGGPGAGCCEMAAQKQSPAAVLRLQRFDGGAVFRGMLAIDPQDDPITIVEGDLWITPSEDAVGESGRSQLSWSDETDGGEQILRAWGTNKRKYFRSEENLFLESTSTDVPAEKLSLSAEPGEGGRYKVTFTCAVLSTVAGKLVGLEFDTGPLGGKSSTYEIHMPTADVFVPVTVSWMVEGNAATMVNAINVWSVDDTTEVKIKEAEIIFEGSHDEITDS